MGNDVSLVLVSLENFYYCVNYPSVPGQLILDSRQGITLPVSSTPGHSILHYPKMPSDFSPFVHTVQSRSFARDSTGTSWEVNGNPVIFSTYGRSQTKISGGLTFLGGGLH